MAKSGSGDIAGAGRREGEFVGWNEGLTDEDRETLRIVADHTSEVLSGLKVAIARGLEAIGIEAESDAAAICPVDTGRLRNSITHTMSDDGKAVEIGTNVPYGKYVHYGTRGHDPQPFLTDAVNNNSGKYRRIFRDALRGN